MLDCSCDMHYYTDIIFKGTIVESPIKNDRLRQHKGWLDHSTITNKNLGIDDCNLFIMKQ